MRGRPSAPHDGAHRAAVSSVPVRRQALGERPSQALTFLAMQSDRDEAAERRDDAARERDRAATERDLDAGVRDHVLAGEPGEDERTRAAQQRLAALGDRQEAQRDREAAAEARRARGEDG